MKDDFKNSALNPGSLLVFTNEMDPGFRGSVILVLAHDTRGTLGIIVNKKHSYSYQKLVDTNPGMDPLSGQTDENRFILAGGPAGENRVFTVYQDQNKKGVEGFTYLDSTSRVAEDMIALTNVKNPNVRVALDYAGWAPDQLAEEIKWGAWRILPYSEKLIFNTPLAEIFPTAAAEAGMHPELVRYILNAASVRAEKGDDATYEYLRTIRPRPPLN